MTIIEAIDAIRQSGSIESDGKRIKVRIDKAAESALQPALDTLRREKYRAIELLDAAAIMPPPDLGAILQGHALELWSDSAGGRLFIVADEADAQRLRGNRGEVLTVDELRLVVRIEDPATAAEVLRWKRAFDGKLSGDGARRNSEEERR